MVIVSDLKSQDLQNNGRMTAKAYWMWGSYILSLLVTNKKLTLYSEIRNCILASKEINHLIKLEYVIKIIDSWKHSKKWVLPPTRFSICSNSFSATTKIVQWIKIFTLNIHQSKSTLARENVTTASSKIKLRLCTLNTTPIWSNEQIDQLIVKNYLSIWHPVK